MSIAPFFPEFDIILCWEPVSTKARLARVEAWENKDRNHMTVMTGSFRDYSDPENSPTLIVL